MEADCQIFLINLLYRFFWFDMPSFLLDTLCISFPMSLLYSKRCGITITNALYMVFCTKNLVWQKMFSLLSLFNATSITIIRWYSKVSVKFFVLELRFLRRTVYNLPFGWRMDRQDYDYEKDTENCLRKKC